MLIDELRTRMRTAMKERRTLERQVLSVALGEIDTMVARSGEAPSDQDVEKVLRKLVKSNEETLAHADGQHKADLEQELEILRSALPKTLTPDEIAEHLTAQHDAIRAAGNDGQATGIAMKALKSAGLAVTGQDVSTAVKKIRA